MVMIVAATMLYRGLSGGLRASNAADGADVALLVAQQRLAAAGIETPLQAGRQEGAEGDVLWQVDLRPYVTAEEIGRGSAGGAVAGILGDGDRNLARPPVGAETQPATHHTEAAATRNERGQKIVLAVLSGKRHATATGPDAIGREKAVGQRPGALFLFHRIDIGTPRLRIGPASRLYDRRIAGVADHPHTDPGLHSWDAEDRAARLGGRPDLRAARGALHIPALCGTAACRGDADLFAGPREWGAYRVCR